MRRSDAITPVIEEIDAIVADAFIEIHRAVYGRVPEASRALRDGDAILLVFRIPAGAGARGPAPAPPLAAIGRMVSAAVFQRSGERIKTGGHSVDAARGLAVLAFEHHHESEPVARNGAASARARDAAPAHRSAG